MCIKDEASPVGIGGGRCYVVFGSYRTHPTIPGTDFTRCHN